MDTVDKILEKQAGSVVDAPEEMVFTTAVVKPVETPPAHFGDAIPPETVEQLRDAAASVEATLKSKPAAARAAPSPKAASRKAHRSEQKRARSRAEGAHRGHVAARSMPATAAGTTDDTTLADQAGEGGQSSAQNQSHVLTHGVASGLRVVARHLRPAEPGLLNAPLRLAASCLETTGRVVDSAPVTAAGDLVTWTVTMPLRLAQSVTGAILRPLSGFRRKTAEFAAT